MKRLTLPLLMMTSVAFAGNISTPIAFDSAQVLPKGVRNLRYNSVMSEANDKYGASGTVVPVGDAMNVDVSFQKMIEGQDSAVERGVLEGYLTRHGKNLENSAGSTTGVVNVEVDAHVPIFAWGITRKWTAAVVVPVVQTSTNVDTGFIASAEFQALAQQAVDEGKYFKAEDMQQKSLQAINRKLEKNGYVPLQNEQKTMLGDIRMVNKLNIQNKRKHAISLVGEIVLPTGEQGDINKIVDPAAGDGQFDLGAGAVAEYFVTPKMTTWTRFHYTWQIQDTTAMRVPNKGDTKITPDIDPQVKRDLGDIFYSSVGTAYELFKGLKTKLQYSFQYKERDKHEGSKYAEGRYNWIGQDSRQRLQALQVGIGYSTIPLFRQKKFAVPLDFNLSAGIPLEGKNVTKDPSVVAEMAMYF